MLKNGIGFLGLLTLSGVALAQTVSAPIEAITGMALLKRSFDSHRSLTLFDAEFEFRAYNPALNHVHQDMAIVAPQVEPLGDDIEDSLVKRAVVCDSDLSLQQALETLSQRVATSSPRQVAVDCRTVGILLTLLRVDLSIRYSNRDTSKLKPPMSQRETELLKETIQQLLDIQAFLLGLEEAALREALKNSPSPPIEKALRAWLKRVDTIKELLSTPSTMTGLFVSDFPKPSWAERVEVVRKISNQLKPFDYSPPLIDENEQVIKLAKVRVAPPLQRLVEVPLPW